MSVFMAQRGNYKLTLARELPLVLKDYFVARRCFICVVQRTLQAL